MSTRYNTGNPIESTDVRDMSDNAKNLDEFSISTKPSFNDRLGVERKTLPTIIKDAEDEFDATIIGMGFGVIGKFSTGGTLVNPRQTMLWDIADGGDGNEYGWSGAFPKTVPPLSTPGSTGGVGTGAWLSRLDPMLRGQVREMQRRSYGGSGYGLVAGSFEAGFTLVNDNDVALQESSGKAFSGSAGTYPAGTSTGGFIDRSSDITLCFRDIHSMLGSTWLRVGQKVCTGTTTWKIVASSKGLDTASTGLYAIPLNGVWVEDAGADSTGATDSHAPIMYIINKYNADTRRKFAVCFGGGHYKSSASISLHSLTSEIKLNFGGATIEATADMDSLISCPAITGLRLKAVKVQHSAGVTIANAMIHINTEGGNGNKTTRHIIDDISAGLITGAPRLLLCDKMWESEIRRMRADRDVVGMTGELVELRSCVNCSVQPCELGYCSVAWRLSKNINVSYGCEGITFNGGVTAYAKIPMAVDSGTAIRLIGIVFDFCETSGPTFTNGQDVTMIGCWVANTSESNGWNGLLSQPSFKNLKVVGCNFINNSPNLAYCGSINSQDSVFANNTSTGCLPGFRYAGGVQEFGNQHSVKGAGPNRFTGESFAFAADQGVAPSNSLSSGVASSNPGQVLQRLTLNAPLLNGNNSVEIDVVQGGASDQPIIKIGWNGSYKFEINPVSGDIGIITHGRGVMMTSPDGLTTKTLRLSNSGSIELV